MTREEAIKEYIIPALKHTWNDKVCKEVLKALNVTNDSKSVFRERAELTCMESCFLDQGITQC